MAHYLIWMEDGEARHVEAKNMKEAAASLVTPDYTYEGDDGFTAEIWRVMGPSKTITVGTSTATVVTVT